METLERKDASTGPEEPIKSEGIMASPSTSDRSNSASSPPPNCCICLGKLINTSFTDSCLHQFCFTCLLQWSKVKTECPLCKQTFKSIIHNVRSEEDYDQYHVQMSQVAATLDVTDDIHLVRRQWLESVGIGAPPRSFRPFMYRTTMGPMYRAYRYNMLLNPEAVARREQIPSVPNLVSGEERRQRTSNIMEIRRNVYRYDNWAIPLSDAFGHFRASSAEYYRQHHSETNRLIPWLNRELQVLLEDQHHIAYVLNVIIGRLTVHNISSPEFRDLIRPYFNNHTEHFVHEFLNFARSGFDLIGYDLAVTYRPSGALSNEFTRAISPTLSTSSTSSSDSDVRVLDDRTQRIIPSVGPHIMDMPGPSTVSQTFRIQLPYTQPDVYTISSTSSSSENECEVIGYVKPRHERTPEIVDLSSSEEPSTSQPTSNNNTESVALLPPPKDEAVPSTSSSCDVNGIRRSARRNEDTNLAFYEYLKETFDSDSEGNDSDYNPVSKSKRHKTSKKTSKTTTRKLRSRKRKKSTTVQRKRDKTSRNRSPSSSSDNESPQREVSFRRGTKRCLSKSSDETDSEKVSRKNKRSKKSKASKKGKKRVVNSKTTSHNYSSSYSSSSSSDSEVGNSKNSLRKMKKSTVANPRYSSEECSIKETRRSRRSVAVGSYRYSSEENSDDEISRTPKKTTTKADSFIYSSEEHSANETSTRTPKKSVTTTDSHNYSSEEPSTSEQSRKTNQRKTNDKFDSDLSDYRCSSCESYDSRDKNHDRLQNTELDTKHHYSSEEAAGSAFSDEASTSKKSNSKSTITTTTGDSNDRLDVATSTTTSASSLTSDTSSHTEHSASSKSSSSGRYRSHKKHKESKKRRRSHS